MTTKVIFRRDKEQFPRLNTSGLTTIYIQYQHNQKSIYFPVFKIDPNQLETVERDGKLELIDPYVRRTKDYKKLVDKIKEVRSTVEEIAHSLNAKNIEPRVEIVRESFDKSRESNTIKEGILEEQFVELYNQYLSTSDKGRWATGTKRQYKSTLSALLRFKQHYGALPKIHEFDLRFYDVFTDYLSEHEGKQKNTTGNFIKNLKAFLGWAKSRGYHVHPDFEHKDFKTIKEKKEIYYLTQEELKQLIDLDLTSNSRLEKVRDVFVFNCRTGMRYGDLRRLSRSHVRKYGTREVIQLIQEKTGKSNYIPITPLPKSILEKYEYQLPIISEVKMNEYLKELCEFAGIDMQVESNKGLIPKYKVISTHVAIKTFITHCAEQSISPKVVAEITGKSLRVIMDHYYGINKNTIMSEMERVFG